MIDKKQLLFELRGYIKYLDFEDLKEIFENAVSYDLVNYEFQNNLYIHFKKDTKVRLIYSKVAKKVYNISWVDLDNYIQTRDNKPSVIFANGEKQWWKNHKLYKREINGKIKYYD